MIRTNIPGFGELTLDCLALDFNGTLAVDGRVLPGAYPRLEQLAESLQVVVATADTFGTAQHSLRDLPLKMHVLERGQGSEAEQKLAFLQGLNPGRTAFVGNGRNDCLALEKAALGICVMQAEGACIQAVQAADILVPDISAALDLLLRPARLTATLRS